MAFAPSLWGPQRIANVITANNQVSSSVAALSDGRFVIGWLSVEPIQTTDFGAYLRLQAFDGFGVRTGANPFIDTSNFPFSGDGLGTPDIAAGAGGTFNVTWAHNAGITNAIPNEIFTQTLAGDMSLLSGKISVANAGFPVTSLTDSHNAIGPTGRTFVEYSDSAANAGDIKAREYTGTALAASGAAFTVNTTTAGAQIHGDAAISGNRAFFLWETPFSPTDQDIYGRIYDATTGAAVSAELALATTADTETNPAVAGIGGGAFAFAYERVSDIYVRTLSAANTVSVPVRVNTSLGGTQVKPAIAGLPDGSIFVAWQDPNGASGIDIRGQLYSAALAPIGSEIVITGAGDQVDPSVTALTDGRIVVSWTEQTGSPNGDGASAGIGYALLETRGATINGTAASDFLIGTDGGAYANNIMSGFDGNDTIYGLSGDDVLVGGSGDDFLLGGAGNDTLFGGDGIDTIYAGDGIDYIQGDGGASSVLVGEGGNDTIYGGAGNDYIVGGDGADVLVGLGGQDSLYGGAGDDYIVAGDGPGSVVDGGAGSNTLWGAGGADYIVGGELTDLEVGGAGSDYLFGNAGADTLYGGQGTDFLYGNAGDDFIWTDDAGQTQSTDYIYAGGGTGTDTIADFIAGDAANHDVLVISPASGVTSFAQVMANATQVGVYTVITLGADRVYLYNVQPFQLTAADFLFF